METQQDMKQEVTSEAKTKFCQHCGAKIPEAAVVCPACGCQVEKLQSAEQPSIVINNANTNTNTNAIQNGPSYGLRQKNKWVAFFLCLFLGVFGAHKFYEGKVGMGVLYLLTFGLFSVGWIIDIITLLFKPNPYYV